MTAIITDFSKMCKLYLPHVVETTARDAYILRSIGIDYSTQGDELFFYDFASSTGKSLEFGTDYLQALLPPNNKELFKKTNDTLLESMEGFLKEKTAIIGKDKIGYITNPDFTNDFYKTRDTRENCFEDISEEQQFLFFTDSYILPPAPFIYNKKDIENSEIYKKFHLPLLDWHQLTIIPGQLAKFIR